MVTKRPLLVVVLTCAVAACGSEAKEDPSSTDQRPATPQERYEGPPATATIEPGNAATPMLRVDVAVPSGGFELRHDETKQREGSTQVLLTLTEPGPDEAVTMALETKTAQVPLTDTKGRVEVLIARVQRGVHYLVAPPHRLAATLPR
jgi:hypothetical protein